MKWICVYDSTYAGSQMCIIVGPNIYLAKIDTFSDGHEDIAVYYITKEILFSR
jgi:hypothetical protein